MSFKCQLCGKQQGSGAQPRKTVVETRNVEYPPVNTADPKARSTYGFETVKELDLCEACANNRR